jgi:hypothetical protein
VGSGGVGAGAGVGVGSGGVGAGVSVGSTGADSGSGSGDGSGTGTGSGSGDGSGTGSGNGNANNPNGQNNGQTSLTPMQAEAATTIGTMIWSSDRVFLGEVISATPAPEGQVDAQVRLSASLTSMSTTLIRFNPKAIYSKKFIMKMTGQEFMTRIVN